MGPKVILILAKSSGDWIYFDVRRIFMILTVCLVLGLFAVPLAKRDLYMHTDIARDFLLIRDVVENKNLTLIGPRSGGIEGVFHGPLWLYLNLPMYVLSGGNPVVSLYFWFGLVVIAMWVYLVRLKKYFSREIAFTASMIYGVFLARLFFNSFNPIGAAYILPLFVFDFYDFWVEKKVRSGMWAFFWLGLIFQFQMAVALPLLIVSLILLISLIVKTKRFVLLFTIWPLCIGLSTFVVFDIRNDWLQLKSVIRYLGGGQGRQLDLGQRLVSFVDSISFPFVGQDLVWLKLVVVVVFGWSIVKAVLKGNKFIRLFTVFWLGFWILTIGFLGMMQSYYFMAFIPFVGLSIAWAKKEMGVVVLVLVWIASLGTMRDFCLNFERREPTSWQASSKMMKKIHDETDGEYGIFLFHPDQYAYSLKYPFYFVNKEDSKGKLYEKKLVTYVVVYPKESDNPYISYDDWKENKARISKQPDVVEVMENGIKIEKYDFDETEIKIESDPNIDLGIFFR